MKGTVTQGYPWNPKPPGPKPVGFHGDFHLQCDPLLSWFPGKNWLQHSMISFKKQVLYHQFVHSLPTKFSFLFLSMFFL